MTPPPCLGEASVKGRRRKPQKQVYIFYNNPINDFILPSMSHDYESLCRITKRHTNALLILVTLEANKQLGSILQWGPDFNVKFEIKISNFDNGGLDHVWSNVLQFTATDKTCCGEGDRLPLVLLRRDSRIVISMWGSFDGSEKNIHYISDEKELNTWYSVEMKQKQVNYDLTIPSYKSLKSGSVYHQS